MKFFILCTECTEENSKARSFTNQRTTCMRRGTDKQLRSWH